ncbi:polysaccharide deacetylase family protein [Fodinisporobacter ferrooxydans]|uniref:Polysaccharide deacetylase family protein n=1 Tax=Fodinisporobacter ferrooxydans TaxID=2901836 RepID=A0ABY4CPU8_9BACL|nr:polysaccharide deacetylase family protein [Alicyclobacillaceae bacterium MYW30-H2]
MLDWTSWSMAAVLALLIVWILYAGLPDLLYHILCIGVFTKGFGGERRIALTFDDGPDPRFTPELLTILRTFGVTATFFVIGQKALQYPELLRQINEEGHEIGIHGFSHTHAWYLTPVRTFREFRDTADAIERITGTRPTSYRPPWGMFNLFTKWAGTAVGATPVLWNISTYDWRKGDQTALIVRTIVKKVCPGSVILLHDSGGASNAPCNTLQAIQEVIPFLQQLNYDFIPISNMKQVSYTYKERYRQLNRIWIQPLWNIWEWLFAKLYKVEVIDPLMRLSINRWQHSNISDEQGRSLIGKGDTVAELHFQNDFLRSLSSEDSSERTAIQAIRQMRKSLHNLAATLQHDPRYKHVKAIYGVTLIHRGAEGVGFHVADIPNTLGNRYEKLFLRWLLILYHPQGAKRLQKRTHLLVPRLVWMSREELFNQYLQAVPKQKQHKQQGAALH